MRRHAAVVAAVLCAAVCARAAPNLPAVAVVPFEAAGVAQDNVDVFADRLAEELAASGTVSVADRHAVGALLARQGLTASDLIDAECAAAVAAQAGADFIAIGKLFAIGTSAGAFVTMLGVKPPTATIAARQAESMADGGNAAE